MKRWLWLVPTCIAVIAWGLWLIFVVAALPDGEAEPWEAVKFRTLAFVVAVLATAGARLLKRGE